MPIDHNYARALLTQLDMMSKMIESMRAAVLNQSLPVQEAPQRRLKRKNDSIQRSIRELLKLHGPMPLKQICGNLDRQGITYSPAAVRAYLSNHHLWTGGLWYPGYIASKTTRLGRPKQ